MLKVQDADRVRLITFARPEALNAFDTELYGATGDALDEARERSDVAVVVLTGEGRAYSAGQDIGEMGRLSSPDAQSSGEAGEAGEYGFTKFIAALEDFPKPVVAAVNGMAIGVGLTMLPYCDLVLVSEAARFRAPFAPLGVVPEAGSSFTLPMAMGAQRAALALFTGEWFDAAEAVASGLAWKACAPDALLDEALDVARRIARLPIVSLVETKRLLLATRLDATRAARAREEAVFARIIGGPANMEAISAFLEKREPDFTNLPPE